MSDYAFKVEDLESAAEEQGDFVGITPPEIFREKARRIIENVRPYLRMDGGDIEFVDAAQGRVFVRIAGACHGCSLTSAHIGEGVGELLRAELPDFVSIVPVLD
ncbi:MAG: NifU family protein [bacterium]|jgi:Fe-S cluster biogenesis protein NfuA